MTNQNWTNQVVPFRLLQLGVAIVSILLFSTPMMATQASLGLTRLTASLATQSPAAGDGLASTPSSTAAAKQSQTRARLIYTGVGALGIVSILSILFCYMRLNHATRGFYSRRLQMGAVIVAMIVVLACVGLVWILN